MLHIALHFLVPWLTAMALAKDRWKKAWVMMIATMLVDLDHLLATPVYDPNRCSINFHPLHHVYLMPLYFLLCFWPKTRWFGVGLLIHMALDAIDCF